MSIFKYFSREQHAHAFLNKGELLLQPLSHFRAIEDGHVRGDSKDGLLSYFPSSGLELNKPDGTTVRLEGWRFTSSARHNEIFVYCASNRLSLELAKRFDSPFCVEILDPCRLTDRLIRRSHPNSVLAYDELVFGAVDYRSTERSPGADWALPQMLAFIKPMEFAWQDELRIVLGRRGAMDVENVTCTVETGVATDSPVPVRSRSLTLRVGSLKELAVLHKF